MGRRTCCPCPSALPNRRLGINRSCLWIFTLIQALRGCLMLCWHLGEWAPTEHTPIIMQAPGPTMTRTLPLAVDSESPIYTHCRLSSTQCGQLRVRHRGIAGALVSNALCGRRWPRQHARCRPGRSGSSLGQNAGPRLQGQTITEVGMRRGRSQSWDSCGQLTASDPHVPAGACWGWAAFWASAHQCRDSEQAPGEPGTRT
jgi:hypothetical protein